jgi:hypothetical protein
VTFTASRKLAERLLYDILASSGSMFDVSNLVRLGSPKDPKREIQLNIAASAQLRPFQQHKHLQNHQKRRHRSI